MAVISHHTMSLDGFVAGLDDGLDRLMGVGRPTDLATRTMRRVGAIVAGRHGFDEDLERGTGVDGIYGGGYDGRVFVLSHRPAPDGVDPRIVFAGDDLPAVLRTAQEDAGDRDVAVFGGSLTRQCLAAGLLDELVVHVVPVLMGEGVRLYGEPGDPTVRLERLEVGEGDQITDLRFRVVG